MIIFELIKSKVVNAQLADQKGFKVWESGQWVQIDNFLDWSELSKHMQQSVLKKISPEYSLEGLILKMKLQFFGHLMQRTDSFEKTLLLGKIESER